MKYLKRILGLPFFLMLNVIGMAFMLLKLSKAFILNGGEALAYIKKDEPKTITNIYEQLQNNYQPNHTSYVTSELVPYHTICTTCKCGGICGCTMANNLVRKPY